MKRTFDVTIRFCDAEDSAILNALLTDVQHRHYKAVADALAAAREFELDVLGSPNMQQHERVERALDRLEQRFVTLFRGDNRGFSEDRFRKAARRDPKMHGKDRVAA